MKAQWWRRQMRCDVCGGWRLLKERGACHYCRAWAAAVTWAAAVDRVMGGVAESMRQEQEGALGGWRAEYGSESEPTTRGQDHHRP